MQVSHGRVLLVFVLWHGKTSKLNDGVGGGHIIDCGCAGQSYEKVMRVSGQHILWLAFLSSSIFNRKKKGTSSLPLWVVFRMVSRMLWKSRPSSPFQLPTHMIQMLPICVKYSLPVLFAMSGELFRPSAYQGAI
jgi:hypothetical protein